MATARGPVIGAVIGGFDGRRGLINHLAVTPESRKQGIATRLMDEVEGRLKAKGCLRCYLLVRVKAADLVRSYGKRGWSPFGVTTLGKPSGEMGVALPISRAAGVPCPVQGSLFPVAFRLPAGTDSP